MLSEVEQEQRPSGNGDGEAIVVGAGLCDGEGERAYTIFDPELGGEKYLIYFKRIAEAKILQKRNNSISKLSIHFRSRFSLTQKLDPKIPHIFQCGYSICRFAKVEVLHHQVRHHSHTEGI